MNTWSPTDSISFPPCATTPASPFRQPCWAGVCGRLLRANASSQWRPYVVSENHTGRMIRSERYKYCVYTEGAIRESLVDMQNDPGEMKNLASLPEYKNALIEHRRYLDRWIEESGDTEAKTFAVEAARE